MEIAEIGMGIQRNANSPTAVAKELGKETFLNLLVTQLKHQDPLAPQDSQEFVAQLVQFSNLEQLTGLNQRMDELKSIQSDTREVLLLSYLGKNVLFRDDTFWVRDEQPVPLRFELGQEARQVQVNIRRGDGTLVNELGIGPRAAGDHQFLFPPKDRQGQWLGEGRYLFEVEATDAQGKSVPVLTLSRGRVTEVTTSGESSYVMVGDIKVPLHEVIRIQE